MRLSAYDQMVARAEQAAQRSPESYRLWLRFFAGIGFTVATLAIIGGIILVLLAIAVLIAAHQYGRLDNMTIQIAGVMGLFGASLTWTLVKTLVSPFPAPQGITLKPDDAQDLFAEITNLSRALKINRIDSVVLTNELFIRFYQRPRLGIFGWHQNTLILGLPLLRQLSVEQARAVIARELGHLRGEHGRSMAKMYRLRETWQTLGERGGNKFLGKFMSWYVPRFQAFSFVLARQQERDADRMASEWTSSTAAGSAFIRQHILSEQHRTFWDRQAVMAAHEAQAPVNMYDRLNNHLQETPNSARRWITEALTRSNNRTEPLPCLQERLTIIGFPYRGELPASIASDNSAAEQWLEKPRHFIELFNKQWLDAHSEEWAIAHQKGQRLLARKAELEKDPLTLPHEQWWELVQLQHQMMGSAAALPVNCAFVALYPQFAPGLFRLGAALLEQGDQRGVPFIEAAMFYDNDAVEPGYRTLRDFADAYGHRGLVNEAEQRLEERAEQEAAAQIERNNVPKPDQLQPHQLNPDAHVAVQILGQNRNDLSAIAVAKIAVTIFPQRPHYLVVLYPNAAWWRMREQNADAQLIAAISAELRLPGTFFVVTATTQPALTKAIEQIDGSRVWLAAEK
jgi:Zn-dependent protease with chaperone function